MSDFIRTDERRWQRKVSDGTYEMYQIVEAPEYVEARFWFAGGGTFSISDYLKEEHDWVLCLYGYKTMERLVDECGDDAEGVLAELLFECNFADFDIECPDTLDEALEYVKRKMGGTA